MDSVIFITFHEELDSMLKNRLRYRMELGEWRRKWRQAKETNDYEKMESLDRSYEMIGLP